MAHRPLIAKRSRIFAAALALLAWLVLAVGAALAEPSAPDAAITVTLYADQDAYVIDSNPADNFGSGPLGVTSGSANVQAYVQFDLSSLPAGITISSATLRMEPNDLVGVDPSAVTAGLVTAAWNEATVTFNTKPAVNPAGPAVSFGTYDPVEWLVTAPVQDWYSGAKPNHGFVLTTGDAGAYFYGKESGRGPELDITYTYNNNDDDPGQAATVFPDLGDAPDNTNHAAAAMNAYTGVPARYPTVYDTPAGQPAGPRHANNPLGAWLGDSITREGEADQGPDADGVNNLLPAPNDPDNDRADDGWRNRSVALPDCRRATLVVRVSKRPAVTQGKAFLNVWFDGSHDGDWEDVGLCQDEQSGRQGRSFEWIVQNFVVDLALIATPGPGVDFVDIPVTTVRVHNSSPDQAHWLRFTLSETPAPLNPATGLADGRGPHPTSAVQQYAFGETEDVVQKRAPEGVPGTLKVSKEVVTPGPGPVAHHAMVTYRLRLQNEGGTGPLEARLGDPVEFPNQIVGPLRVTGTPGVSPLQGRIIVDFKGGNDDAVAWQGTLPPDGGLEVEYDVASFVLCPPGVASVPLTNTVQACATDGQIVQTQAGFVAACPSFSLDKIQVAQFVDYRDEDDLVTAATGSDDDRRVALAATITNTNAATVTLNLQWEVVKSANAAASANVGSYSLTLGPNEHATIDRPAKLDGVDGEAAAALIEPDPETVLTSRILYQFAPEDAPPAAVDTADPALFDVHEYDFTRRLWDVGDAPDSTNHFGAAMSAYPGVQANFPTVIDAATGLPVGPAHARPRPLHLGERVEVEPDADLGPGPRNLEPPANVANHDRYDDGAQPNAWSLTQCQVTTFPVRIFISPAAVARFQQAGAVAYLNAWLDGNRDGDWEDDLACPSVTGLPDFAFEHIVIDGQVDVVALGPGLHTVTVATGRIPVPAQPSEQPAWVRLTLSERPSIKTAKKGGVDYGDGRGDPAKPFATGETEDYLLRPQAGPDLGVDVEVGWDVKQPVDAAGVSVAGPDITINFTKVEFRMHVHYENQGDTTAEDALLKLNFPTLPAGATLESFVAWPPLPGTPPTDIAGLQNVALGDINGDGRGDILVKLLMDPPAGGVSAAAAPLAQWNVDLTNVNTPDIFPGNNSTSGATTSAIELENTMISGFSFVAKDSPFHSLSNTTCSDAIEFHGRGPAGATLDILDNGRVIQTANVDANGDFVAALTGLQKGVHRLQAQVSGAQAADANLLPALGTQPSLIVKVDPDLPFDPASFGITDGTSNTIIFALRGWSLGASNPFQAIASIAAPEYSFGVTRAGSLALVPPGDYTARVNACKNEVAIESIELNLTPLTDTDGDGTWTGPFTMPAVQGSETNIIAILIGLLATRSGGEIISDFLVLPAAPGHVVDAQTGAPIPGARVRLMEEEGIGFGLVDPQRVHANPATTDANGQYTFAGLLGSDEYFLNVTADGYQPLRTIRLPYTGTITADIALTPLVSKKPDKTVALGEGGPDLGVLTVAPGAVVRFLNTTLDDVAVTHDPNFESWANLAAANEPATAAAMRPCVAPLCGGVLEAGESYTVVMPTVGAYGYSDDNDPSLGGVIYVDEGAEAPEVFLPAIRR